MVERKENLETLPISRKQVVNAFSIFPQKGILHPDDLDITDPQVSKAYDMFETWRKHVERNSATNRQLQKYNYQTTTLFVDAGFQDPSYLAEIADDLLPQDLQNANLTGYGILSQIISHKIKSIQAKLNQT